jgi:hypothetical protein
MTLTVDLPKNVIERIQEYQAKQTTGQITLNFNEGKIQSIETKQYAKVKLHTNLID